MQQGHNDSLDLRHKLLRRNFLWNFAGNIIPLLAAIICIPILITNLGVDRFGLLALVWLTIGYFNFLDLGLGRSVTKLVAERIDTGRDLEIRQIIQIGMTSMLLLGFVGSLLVLFLVPNFLKHLNITTILELEARQSLLILAFAIPPTIMMAGLRGILEAYSRFDLITYVRIPLALFNYIGPLAIIPFSNSLDSVVSVLVVGRLVSFILCVLMVKKVGIDIGKAGFENTSLLKSLISFGGWMTVTNIIGPIMVYMDRFLIGMIISASAVAYYVTPYEMVTKILIIPGAIVGVLFPAFSATVNVDPIRTSRLLDKGLMTICYIVFPMIFVAFMFSYEIIGYWINFEFSHQSHAAMRWLVIGVMFNCVAQVWCILVQSSGRADVAAKIHIIELPIYLAALWWLTKNFGIIGTSMAWTIRIILDSLVFCFVTSRMFPHSRRTVGVSVGLLVASCGTLAVGALITSSFSRAVYMAVVLGCAWHFLRHWLTSDQTDRTIQVT